MQHKLSKFFNDSTRLALFEGVRGYVDKSMDVDAELGRLAAEYQLERVRRFDLGENAFGYSPLIRDYLADLRSGGGMEAQENSWFNAYPDRSHLGLKRRLGERFGVDPAWILVGAGLDALLDLITRVFLQHRDTFVAPAPSFYLFEEYSERMGAVPFFVPLSEEDGFRWNARTTQQFKEVVDKARPKLIWIANPNNPTGDFIQDMVLEELMDVASAYNAFIVIDEAYGEYTDPPEGVASAARFLGRYPNLLVLRTFSKMYGLAGLRLGYLMCASPEIHDGLRAHNHHFPVTQITTDLARVALEDEGFLEHSRQETRGNGRKIFAALQELGPLCAMPTRTSIFMLKHRWVPGPALMRAFEQRGILAASADLSGIEGKGYLRFTVRSAADNECLIRACRDICETIGDRRAVRRSAIDGPRRPLAVGESE